MRRLKLFPKIFLYTLSIMLFVSVVTHGLIYLLAPRMQLALSTQDDVVISVREEQFVTEAVEKALPVSLGCSLLISVVCSLLFSKAIADPIKRISASTEQMMKLDRGANCPVHTKDEIGTLAQNVNDLYAGLLSTITGPEVKAQIVGLFTPNVVERFGETVTDYDKIQNRVFVDLQTSTEISGDTINYGFSALHVTIDDPQDMAQVVADVKALPGIDWKAFAVEVDNETYENAAAPLAALNELVVTLLAVIIVVSAVILALILTLWTKTRIHEIGVFLSVGIRKPAIIGQFLMEVLLIAVIAFGLSYFTSNTVAGQIGNRLLEQSLQTEPEDESGVSAAAAVEVGADELIQKPLPGADGIEVSVGLKDVALPDITHDLTKKATPYLTAQYRAPDTFRV